MHLVLCETIAEFNLWQKEHGWWVPSSNFAGNYAESKDTAMLTGTHQLLDFEAVGNHHKLKVHFYGQFWKNPIFKAVQNWLQVNLKNLEATIGTPITIGSIAAGNISLATFSEGVTVLAAEVSDGDYANLAITCSSPATLNGIITFDLNTEFSSDQNIIGVDIWEDNSAYFSATFKAEFYDGTAWRNFTVTPYIVSRGSGAGILNNAKYKYRFLWPEPGAICNQVRLTNIAIEATQLIYEIQWLKAA